MQRHFFLLLVCLAMAVNGFAATAPSLPASAELKTWYSFVQYVEKGLESGDRKLAFEMKRAHVYPKVRWNGELVGAFRSASASTNVEGEIATFNIARALGCEDLFQQATGVELRGKGLATLTRLFETAKFPAEKEKDRRQVLAEIAGEPEVLHGVFKQALPVKAVKYRSIERAEATTNGVLNEADPVARFLKRRAPQPGMEPMTPPGIKGQAPTRTLARQLSSILLVDALAGQWDRFSGGNLHMLVEDGGARFIAVDNGGAGFKDDQGYLGRFKKTVTRFDPRVTARLFALEAFLEKGGRFLDFHDEHSLAEAMRIDEREHWDVFKDRVRQVAAHVRASGEGSLFEE